MERSTALNPAGGLIPDGRQTGGVVGVQLRSGGGGGAGLLETQGVDWH